MADLIAMYDSVTLSEIPADPPAVAAYVDGEYANATEATRRFPHALILTIAVDPAHDADCLDIETGDATPADAAGWYDRQRARGVTRPVLYANASTMQADVVPVIQAARIGRGSVRLWSAHYLDVAHICGPHSCGELSIDADGTQWTSTAMGRDLDESLLLADFFGTPPAPHPHPAPPPAQEDDVQSGQLSNGPGAVTVITVPQGSARTVAFGCDNDLQGLPPAKLRVAIFDTQWHVSPDVVVDSAKGQTVLVFSDKAKTGVISVRREDAGDAVVGWQVS
jgi:hypothetical protein